MPHPHKSFLDEFQIAIDHMVPLTPEEVIKEAKDLHAELLADEDSTEKKIHQALSVIGRKEFPYRKAYDELCAGDEEQRLQTAVFDRLEDSVKKKVMDMTKHGVILEEYVASPLFEEQLEGDERYQVEQAILLADEVLDNQCDDRAHKRKADYESLVKSHSEAAAKLQGMIDRLRAMAPEDAKWTGEIEGAASRLEEGWAITEKDPTEIGITKELEYWNTVLHEEGENVEADTE